MVKRGPVAAIPTRLFIYYFEAHRVTTITSPSTVSLLNSVELHVY